MSIFTCTQFVNYDGRKYCVFILLNLLATHNRHTYCSLSAQWQLGALMIVQPQPAALCSVNSSVNYWLVLFESHILAIYITQVHVTEYM